MNKLFHLVDDGIDLNLRDKEFKTALNYARPGSIFYEALVEVGAYAN